MWRYLRTLGRGTNLTLLRADQNPSLRSTGHFLADTITLLAAFRVPPLRNGLPTILTHAPLFVVRPQRFAQKLKPLTTESGLGCLHTLRHHRIPFTMIPQSSSHHPQSATTESVPNNYSSRPLVIESLCAHTISPLATGRRARYREKGGTVAPAPWFQRGPADSYRRAPPTVLECSPSRADSESSLLPAVVRHTCSDTITLLLLNLSVHC